MLTHIIQNGEDLNSIAKKYQTSMREIVAANPGLNFYNLYVGDVLTIVPGEDYRIKLNAPGAQNVKMSFAKVKLRDEMRKLWEQHVAWTQLFIVSTLAGLPDERFVTQRLLRNPADLGQLFGQYYGDAVGKKVNDLLTEHLVVAADLVKALKAGDTAKASQEDKKLFMNADKMAATFASINPFWKQEDMKNMLYKHLNLIKQGVTNRMQGNYAAEIQTIDLNEQHLLEMADVFSNGIWKQAYGNL
ncbi:MAG: acetylglutamate kinase [Bacillales bacterium]|jgi:LysM repeat protein|nr:acetylglutamate kinase [Bacillales bacterium]